MLNSNVITNNFLKKLSVKDKRLTLAQLMSSLHPNEAVKLVHLSGAYNKLATTWILEIFSRGLNQESLKHRARRRVTWKVMIRKRSRRVRNLQMTKA